MLSAELGTLRRGRCRNATQDYVALSWKGFATGAACGLYLFLYCLDYYGSLSSLRPLSFANGARSRTNG